MQCAYCNEPAKQLRKDVTLDCKRCERPSCGTRTCGLWTSAPPQLHGGARGPKVWVCNQCINQAMAKYMPVHLACPCPGPGQQCDTDDRTTCKNQTPNIYCVCQCHETQTTGA